MKKIRNLGRTYGWTEGWTDVNQYTPHLSMLFCIPNMNCLFYTVVEISLTTNVERKKNV